MSQDEPVALRAHIKPEQFLAMLKTKAQQAKSAAQVEEHKLSEARHKHDVAQQIAWAVDSLAIEVAEKFKECLEGLGLERI